jgi:hypothetical protein
MHTRTQIMHTITLSIRYTFVWPRVCAAYREEAYMDSPIRSVQCNCLRQIVRDVVVCTRVARYACLLCVSFCVCKSVCV